jgi:MYXO-CTERM domain-containing protein
MTKALTLVSAMMISMMLLEQTAWAEEVPAGEASCSVAGAGPNSGWAGMAMLAVTFLGVRRRPRRA